MESLPTYTRTYILSAVAFLIPAASSMTYSQNFTDNIANKSPIDFDEQSQGSIDSDFNLEAVAQTKAKEINAVTIAEIVDIDTESSYFLFPIEAENKFTARIKPNFWTTLHSIESKQGKLLYRPNNKSRNCDTTSSPCGHHQLTRQALKDISCASNQCMKDREDFQKSLVMSKKLQALNDKRLTKAGYTNLPEYQRYLIHQQGATGLKIILGASQGEKLLSRNMKKNMASNSPFSYKKLRRFGSKLAAEKFLKHWEEKWQDEKDLVIASNTPNKRVEAVIKSKPSLEIPLFNNHELQIALNLDLN